MWESWQWESQKSPSGRAVSTMFSGSPDLLVLVLMLKDELSFGYFPAMTRLSPGHVVTGLSRNALCPSIGILLVCELCVSHALQILLHPDTVSAMICTLPENIVFSRAIFCPWNKWLMNPVKTCCLHTFTPLSVHSGILRHDGVSQGDEGITPPKTSSFPETPVGFTSNSIISILVSRSFTGPFWHGVGCTTLPPGPDSSLIPHWEMQS